MIEVSSGWGRINLPYTLRKLAVGKHVYLPVNRNYAPLGFPYQDGQGDDLDYVGQAMSFASDPALFTGVWWSESAPLSLYADGNETRLTYWARLEKLLSHAIQVPLHRHPNSTSFYLRRTA